MGIHPINGYLGDKVLQVKMNGVQAIGSSQYSAREDHVHPVDTSRADAAATTTALGLKVFKTDATGLLFGIPVAILIADWTEIGEGASWERAIAIAGLTAASFVQIRPAVLTYAAFDALAVTIKTIAAGILTITTTVEPIATLGLSILYTKPALFP